MHTKRQRVKAIVQLNDVDSEGEGYEHARPGDFGTIIGTFPDAVGPTVRWDRNGTLCDVHETEFSYVDDE